MMLRAEFFLIYCSSADERDLSQSSYPGWGFTIWTLSYLSLLNNWFSFAFLSSIPYDLLVLFLSILPRWTGRNMCPSAVRGIGFLHGNCQALFFLSPPPWIFILFTGIVFPFLTTLEIYLIFRHFPTKGQQIVAAMETPPWKVFSTFGKTR